MVPPRVSPRLGELQRRWAGIPQAAQIQRVTLHYIDGAIEAEVILPLAAPGVDVKALGERLRTAAEGTPHVSKLHFLYAERTN